MLRLKLMPVGLLIASSAFAGEQGAPAVQPPLNSSPAVAAADRVYPPLPTLSMLPPSVGDDEELPQPRPSAKRRKPRVSAESRFNVPPARLVVSDASRTYLIDVERRIQVAFAK